MSKLTRWDAPFADKFLPSVTLVTSSHGSVTVIVADAIDKYPKYQVSFDRVIAFTCMEEMHSPRDFADVNIPEGKVCAFIWEDSPWLSSYEQGVHFVEEGNPVPLFHYLIFGGDNNVEIITASKPTVSVVNEKTLIAVHYQI